VNFYWRLRIAFPPPRDEWCFFPFLPTALMWTVPSRFVSNRLHERTPIFSPPLPRLAKSSFPSPSSLIDPLPLRPPSPGPNWPSPRETFSFVPSCFPKVRLPASSHFSSPHVVPSFPDSRFSCPLCFFLGSSPPSRVAFLSFPKVKRSFSRQIPQTDFVPFLSARTFFFYGRYFQLV